MVGCRVVKTSSWRPLGQSHGRCSGGMSPAVSGEQPGCHQSLPLRWRRGPQPPSGSPSSGWLPAPELYVPTALWSPKSRNRVWSTAGAGRELLNKQMDEILQKLDPVLPLKLLFGHIPHPLLEICTHICVCFSFRKHFIETSLHIEAHSLSQRHSLKEPTWVTEGVHDPRRCLCPYPDRPLMQSDFSCHSFVWILLELHVICVIDCVLFSVWLLSLSIIGELH